jgi:hypothetical protein
LNIAVDSSDAHAPIAKVLCGNFVEIPLKTNARVIARFGTSIAFTASVLAMKSGEGAVRFRELHGPDSALFPNAKSGESTGRLDGDIGWPVLFFRIAAGEQSGQ